MIFGLGPLVVLIAVVAAVWAAGRHHRHPAAASGDQVLTAHRAPRAAPERRTVRHRKGDTLPQMTSTPTTGRAGRHGGDAATPALDEALSVWTGAGLITDEQAAAIRAFEEQLAQRPATAPESAPRRVPLVAEALGYLGGILGTVGLVLLIARYWTDMAGIGRLALTGGGAAALVIAGALLHESEPAIARLRWFLWLAAAAATALFAGVAVDESIDHPSKLALVLAGAGAVTALDAVLWAWRERPVQQLLTLAGAATALTVGLVMTTSDGIAGIALLTFGVAVLLLGWAERTPLAAITALVGSGSMVVGSVFIASFWEGVGQLFTALTALALLTLVTMPDRVSATASSVRTAVLVVAGVGTLASVPATIGYFARDGGIATGLTLCALGAVMTLAGGRLWVRAPMLVQTAGGMVMVGGAAITGVQSVAVATVLGLVLAVGLISLGTVPGHVLLSLCGSVGLLVNVPWAIVHFFPGEGRAPLLILASGAVIVGVAVRIARLGGRIRRELHR